MSLPLYSQQVNLSEHVQHTISEYVKLADTYRTEKNLVEEAKYTTKIAYLYWQNNRHFDAVDYFEKSIEINKKAGNKNAVKVLNGNIGMVYLELEDYHAAIKFFEVSLKYNRMEHKNQEIGSDLLNIAMALFEIKEYNESIIRLKEALNLAKELKDIELIKNCYSQLAENYEKLGDSKKSMAYYDLYVTLQKHLQKEELKQFETRTKQAEASVEQTRTRLKNTFDTLHEVLQINKENEMQIALLNKERELQAMKLMERELREQEAKKRNQVILGSAGILIVISLFFSLIFYGQYRSKKKANVLLQEQNQKIEKQKVEIEKQRDISEKQRNKITDSIQYAKKIQQAVIPPETILNESLEDYFILYKPRDIVSGDFYWITQKDGILIITAADCTGHGVPGAFMSMLGIAFLNEIVNKIAINRHISSLQADEILNELRENVIRSLHQTGDKNEPHDGLDIAICLIDKEKKKIQFAGAHNPMYLIRNGELLQYPGDKMPVSYHRRKDVPFTKQEINLQDNDLIYLFSDGIIDQFGHETGMKFLSKNFRELLLRIHKEPMEEQKRLILKSFNDWKGEVEQIDDILVIGLKYSSVTRAYKEAKKAYKKILIAEDTDVNYFFLVEALKTIKELQVIRAKDGLEAVEFCKTNNIDLVLMDINMPNMNGYEATKRIKKENNKIPVIVQTAMNFGQGKEDSVKAGADDFICKPIDLKSFIAKIKQYV